VPLNPQGPGCLQRQNSVAPYIATDVLITLNCEG
jgi:hypothetical protein